MELFSPEVTRPALRYHGGKFRLATWLVPQFPAPDSYECYVEVFGGGAGVLSRKSRARIEVYNDLESQVVNYFAVLRDPLSRAQLIELVELTPFSREEFDLSYEAASDPVEAARRFVVRSFMGHGTCSMDPQDSNGFRSCDIRSGKSYAREWHGVPEAMSAVGRRFEAVTIENLDFRKLIPKFDSPSTFFYVDPPYLMGTRVAGGKGYVHEMTREDHRRLAWLLRQAKAKVAISHYPCSLYEELYDGWIRSEKKVSANGQRGSVPRTEALWINYEEKRGGAGEVEI